ncbi:hypothetical protein BRC88_01975 [Halobacteriales archaeon QS_4_69_225]|nr:MAG: hypothetical protein BRC88_01975 [Halobacteriales archaeon QS_4_69_225]
MAILDVSAYTRAESEAELDRAEMTVLSFLPNENGGASVMDVRPSADGNYVFVSKQAIAVLYGDEEVRTEPDSAGTSPEAGSIQAVDVRDPGDPEVVGRWSAYGLGVHNADHLRIGGTDYVFAVKGPIGVNAGIYVVRFDRTTGSMSLVNYWSNEKNHAAGEISDPRKGQYATRGYDYYLHDIRVERDPQTGVPVAYAADLNNGAFVLSASDPTEMETLGHFDMYRAHEIWPITATDGDGNARRLFVAGQENPSSTFEDGFGSYGQNVDGDTGWLYLVDAQALDPGAQEESIDLGAAREHHDYDKSREPPLARWQLSDQVSFENYTFSLHNVEPFETVEDGQVRQFVAAGHYHAGIRFLEFSEALGHQVETNYIDDTTVAEDDVDPDEHDHDDDHAEEYDWGAPVSNGDDGMGQVAYFRSHVEDYPESAKFAELTAATPDFWCAVEENGVVFGSGINTGVYAVTVDDPDVPVGTRTPADIRIDRNDDASAFTAGQTNMVKLSVETDAPVRLRDRVPSEWNVLEANGDVESVEDAGDGQLVTIEGTVEDGDEVTYFVEAPAETGSYTLGRTEFAVDDGGPRAIDGQWQPVAGTETTVLVVGVGTNL